VHHGGGGSILIVDDDPAQRRTASRVLTQLGYTVRTIKSGERALHLFQQGRFAGASPFQLVVMDVMLNEASDGVEFMWRIRELFSEQLGVLASGLAPDAQATRLLREQGLSWLQKPYTSEQLALAVGSALATDESVASVGGTRGG
jgi:CheY-like chemotaxis protein